MPASTSTRATPWSSAIKPLVRATRRPGADAEIGGFGGLFDLKAAGFRDPVLVAANDGVGTKVKIAIESGMFDTIGDRPRRDVRQRHRRPGRRAAVLSRLFRDRQARSRAWARRSSTGIANACVESGCALIGGETAEMPGLYAEGDFDLAGFAVGAAERGTLAAARGAEGGRPRDRPAVVGRPFQRLFAGAPHRRR